MTARPGRTGLTHRLLGVALVSAAVSGCSGTSCDELAALQAEREQLREEYVALVGSGAGPAETAEADDALHAFERRVYDVEQACARR